MEHASVIAVEILKAARRWVASRVVLRRVMDSKSATQRQVEEAQRDHHKLANELEALVIRLERFLHNSGKKFPTKRGPDKQFPWRELFGVMSAGARAIETALEGSAKRPIIDIIDAESTTKK